MPHDPGSFYFQIVRGSELILGLIIPATGASGTIKYFISQPHMKAGRSQVILTSAMGSRGWALDGACLWGPPLWAALSLSGSCPTTLGTSMPSSQLCLLNPGAGLYPGTLHRGLETFSGQWGSQLSPPLSPDSQPHLLQLKTILWLIIG